MIIISHSKNSRCAAKSFYMQIRLLIDSHFYKVLNIKYHLYYINKFMEVSSYETAKK